ncbi:MAG: hypothetical protein HS115_02420 [Spirochaetales bacterium]|nr:hypothetical protein [Spirochaetales bacterium]
MNYAIVLRALMARPQLHASWLSTLSLLEYVGARKISRTFRLPTAAVISHFAEEARHARFFKERAERLDPGSRPLLAGRARLYFERLDAGVARLLLSHGVKEPQAAYVLVTRVIEERATDLYTDYNRLLKEMHHPFTLDGVLAEEGRHLQLMEELTLAWGLETCLQEARQEEVRHFEPFFALLERLATGAAEASLAEAPLPGSR